jgi:hypothetical protein
LVDIILFLVSLIVNVILTLWITTVRLNKIKRDKTYIQEIKAEMAQFMVALEQNVAGYVALMEKMRQDADAVLESVNRKLRVVEKESQKLEQTRNTYSDLSKRKPLVSSIVDIQKQQGLTSTRYNREETPPISVASSAGRSSMQNLSGQLRDATPMLGETPMPSQINITAEPTVVVSQANQPTAIRTGHSKSPSTKQIAAMWRDGVDAKEIAEKLNLSMGEVELALELMGSRRL